MNKLPFQYAVLRYIHDPITEEFLNIGVVVYSPEMPYLKALINQRYARLSEAFQQINGTHYRAVTEAIDRRIWTLGSRLQKGDWATETPERLETLLATVLVPDDSSFIFSHFGGGLSDNLDKELDYLYERLVIRYAHREEVPRRDDEQVLRAYLDKLARWDIPTHLEPTSIRTETFEYTFSHAWKNERWHPIEALSFDLVRPTSITNKASRWIGHIASLRQSDDLGKVYFLLGQPSDPTLRRAYENAKANMKNTLREIELVEEHEADSFGERFAQIIKSHSKQPT